MLFIKQQTYQSTKAITAIPETTAITVIVGKNSLERRIIDEKLTELKEKL
jgi:hypothetical protein